MIKPKCYFLFISFLFINPFNSASEEYIEVQRGANINAILNLQNDTIVIKNNNDFLLSSIYTGNYQIVSDLLLKGADPNSIFKRNTFQKGYSALMFASYKGYYDIAKLLIKRGADVNYKTTEGLSALIIAAQKGYYNIAELLIESKTDINSRTIDGSSALFEAVKQLNDSITALLIKNNSRVNIIDRTKFTPLQYCVGYNLIYLKLSGKLNTELEYSFVHHSKANIISELLINAGANLEVKDIYGFTPLLVAVHLNNLEIVKALCKAGANPNVVSKDGLSPLLYASSNNLTEIARVLIDYEAIEIFIPSAYSSYVSIPSLDELLIINADSGNYKSVYFLLEHGANPNYTTEEGITALMYASDNGSYNIVKLLLENGADVNSKPLDGNTALFAAVRANNDSIAELLIQNKAQINTPNLINLYPLHYAAGYGYPRMTDLLLYYGAQLDISDSYGNTPLMSSVYAGAYNAIDLLINYGANVNKPDKLGNTPIMIAAQFNDTTLISKLYTAGADLNAINNRKVNALTFALQNNSVEAFKMILNLGAKVDSSASDKTLYQQAIDAGNKEICTLLKQRNLRTKIKPSVGGINFYTGFSTSSNDFMFDIGTGIYEPAYKMLISLGYKYRPFSSHILEYRDNLFYQFWEKRYSIYLSVEHLYELKKNYLKGDFGFAFGLNGELSWRFLHGSNNDRVMGLIVPHFGLYYHRGFGTFVGKWELANYRSKGIGFNRFALQYILTIPNTQHRVINKKINWLD